MQTDLTIEEMNEVVEEAKITLFDLREKLDLATDRADELEEILRDPPLLPR